MVKLLDQRQIGLLVYSHRIGAGVGDPYRSGCIINSHAIDSHDLAFVAGLVGSRGNAGLNLQRIGVHFHQCRLLDWRTAYRSEEHTTELQSLMRISYAVLCLKKKNKK